MRPSWMLPLGALGLVVTWWYWRVEGPIAYQDLQIFINSDLFSYYYPTVRFAFAELAQGHMPLWNPYQLAGQPFFANQQHGLLYPFNALFLFLEPQLAFKCTAVLHYILGFLFAAYLGRVIGLSYGATWFAAVSFTFTGYLFNLLYVRTWLNGAVWLPLELALAIRLFREVHPLRPAAWLVVAFAAQFVGGYPMYNLLAAYCLGLFALWEAVRMGRQGRWRPALRRTALLGGAGVCAAAVSAVQLLPMIEMTWQSPRRLGALTALTANPMFQRTLGRASMLLLPMASPSSPNSAYLGAAIVPLVVCSFLHPTLRPMAGFFLTLALAAAAFVLASASPVWYAFLFRLPTINWFRFPEEIFFLVAFGAIFCGAIGADALAGRHSRTRTTLMVALLLLSAVALVLRLPLVSPFAWGGRRASVLLLGAAIPAILFVGGGRRLVWAAVIAVTWVDLALASANYAVLPDVAADRFEPPASLIRFLREHQNMQRTYLHAPLRRPPLAKVGMTHGVFVISDHESLLPSRFAEYLGWLQGSAGASMTGLPQGDVVIDPTRGAIRLLDLLGVRYIVSTAQSPFPVDAHRRYAKVFEAEGTQVYENPYALPRAFVVGTAQVTAADAILPTLARAEFDPTRLALVETQVAALSGGVSRPAQIVEYAPERIVVRVGGNTPGLLIVTDQYYPGWQATVDGEAAPIYCADYVFRAVPVPSGEHTVTLRYRPRSLTLGCWLSVLTLAVGITMIAIHRFAPRRKASADTLTQSD